MQCPVCTAKPRQYTWHHGSFNKRGCRGDRALLASMPIKCQRAREAIMYNQVFLNHIVQAYDAILCRGPNLQVNFSDDPPDTLVEPNDVEKVRYGRRAGPSHDSP